MELINQGRRIIEVSIHKAGPVYSRLVNIIVAAVSSLGPLRYLGLPSP